MMKVLLITLLTSAAVTGNSLPPVFESPAADDTITANLE